MVTTWIHNRTIKTMVATAVIAAITSLTIIPLITLLFSLFKSDTTIWAHLVEFVLPDLLLNTAYLLVGVALCTTFLGTTLGWLLGVCEFPGYRWWRLLLLLPLALPAYVVAFVWVALFDSTGLVTLWLREHVVNASWFSIRSTVGAILIMSLSFYPYVYLTARTAFEAQSNRLNEAAHSVGLTASQTFFKIDLPLARPAIMAGLLLVMMEVLADFGAVSVLNYNTFTTAIYKTWFSLFSLSAAAQLSGILVMMVMVIIIISQWNRGQKSYFANSRINNQPKRIRLHGKQAVAAFVFCAFIFVVAVAIPFGTLLFWAANQLHLLIDARYIRFIMNSFLLASCGSLIIVCVALTLSYTQRAAKLPSLFLLGRFATIGYALPGTVLAVGVYIPLAWINQQWNAVQTSLGLASSVLIGGVLSILIGYCARFLAVAEGPIRTGLLRLSPQMDEASTSLGLSTGKRLWLIDAPLLKSSILTAALLCFVDLMKELPITLMMRPFDWDTLAVRIFELISESAWQEASLPALLIVMVGLLPIILLNRR